MFNKAILMGRICNDLELRTTPNGVSVLTFRIAVDRRFQTRGEERKSDFFNVVAWRQTAEFISRFFSKGRMILVEGELQTRQYVDKNNSTQTVVELVVDNACFTGEAKGIGSGYGSYPPPPTEAPAAHPAAATNSAPVTTSGNTNDFVETTDSDDEYPF